MSPEWSLMPPEAGQTHKHSFEASKHLLMDEQETLHMKSKPQMKDFGQGGAEIAAVHNPTPTPATSSQIPSHVLMGHHWSTEGEGALEQS